MFIIVIIRRGERTHRAYKTGYSIERAWVNMFIIIITSRGGKDALSLQDGILLGPVLGETMRRGERTH
jgi:hypothetical protein